MAFDDAALNQQECSRNTYAGYGIFDSKMWLPLKCDYQKVLLPDKHTDGQTDGQMPDKVILFELQVI